MTYEMKILEERRAAWQQSREIALAEGLEKGFERGISQGIEQGIERGISQGFEQGVHEQKILMAERMISRGFSYNDIVDMTGLSEEEIEDLRK